MSTKPYPPRTRRDDAPLRADQAVTLALLAFAAVALLVSLVFSVATLLGAE
jgi:hypothetical protein